jgi:Ribonuclease HII
LENGGWGNMDYSNMSVREIHDVLKPLNISEKTEAIDALIHDGRAGVRKIADGLKREIEEHNKEIERINKLKQYEYKYAAKGVKYIAGIDEVGRGPLAGPVFASAVVFPVDCIIEGVNDSKKLSPQKRSSLYSLIKENAISSATGYCDEKTIDRINILNATYEAMKMALIELNVRPDLLLIDAVRIPGIDIPQVPIIKGDSLCFSIAAASIVAKVERDKLMDDYHKIYPKYNFLSNKGYGTQEHMDAIRKYGPCPIHRRSFISGIR